MIPIVAQFLIGFFVIILAFAGGLNVLYGDVSSLWSGGNEFMDSAKNAFTGLGNQVTNNVFQPYVFYWLGDITLFVYLIVCGIVLVNMLIAMMGSKFSDITQKHLLLRKQQFYKGEAFIEFAHSLLPAPLNIFHVIFLLLTKPCWPFGEFDRWMYYSIPNPFIFTGQLREMWSEYIDWLSQKNGDKEKKDDDDYFQEKDQYDAAGDVDEDSAYVAKHAEIKPFMDSYFRTWRGKFFDEQTQLGGKGDDHRKGDEKISKGKETKKISSPRESVKQTKSQKKRDDDDDNYIALQDNS